VNLLSPPLLDSAKKNGQNFAGSSSSLLQRLTMAVHLTEILTFLSFSLNIKYLMLNSLWENNSTMSSPFILIDFVIDYLNLHVF